VEDLVVEDRMIQMVEEDPPEEEKQVQPDAQLLVLDAFVLNSQ
jgi:hypothetical protein